MLLVPKYLSIQLELRGVNPIDPEFLLDRLIDQKVPICPLQMKSFSDDRSPPTILLDKSPYALLARSTAICGYFQPLHHSMTQGSYCH